MICKVTFSVRAKNQLEFLNKEEGKKILGWLVTNIQGSDDPRATGNAIRSEMGDFWLYKVEKYNMYCILTEDRLVILSIEADRNNLDH